MSVLDTIAGVGLTLATAGTWRTAALSKRSGTTLETIERERRHTELTPQFTINAKRADGNKANAMVYIELVGPPGLDHLDRIKLYVRDDIPDIAAQDPLPGGPTKAEIAAHVWGPYRFSHGSNGADADGRSIDSFALKVGEQTRRALTETRPPHWNTSNTAPESWRQDYTGKPIRFALECHKDGFDPWTVPYVLPITWAL